MKLELRELTLNDEAAFLEAKPQWDGSPQFGFLLNYKDGMKFSDFVQELQNHRDGINLPANFVSASSYFAFVDGKIVGRGNLRHELNDFLRQFGGHIGYGVLPQYRKRGYATEILRQTIKIAHRLGIKPILVTCDDDNVGSIKTIENCGGVLQNIISQGENKPLKRRYWI